MLKTIPVLPALLDSEKKYSEATESSQAAVSDDCSKSQEEAKENKPVTLLDWISTADHQSSMQQLFEHCQRGLEQVKPLSIRLKPN